MALTVLVFQCTAKFISVTEIHTYVINEMKKKVFNIFVSSHVHVLISLLFCHHIPEKLRATVRKYRPLSGKSRKMNFAYFLTIKSY